MFLFHSFARWATPKRCCSSIITKPIFLKVTTSSRRAWVPIRIWRLPSCKPRCISSRSFFLVDPVSRATVIPISFNISDTVA